MNNSWQRIENWLTTNAPDILRGLRPPASPIAIDKASIAVGIDLPTDLLEGLYHVHDGQKSNAQNLLDEWELLPLARVSTEWRMLKELRDEGDFESTKSRSSGITRQDWWHPQWIPFAANGAGDFLCTDLAPGPKGTLGQVIVFRHEDATRELVATSVKQLFADYAQALEKLAQQTAKAHSMPSSKAPAKTKAAASEIASMPSLMEWVGQSIKSAAFQQFMQHHRLQQEKTEDGLTIDNPKLGIEIACNRKGVIETIFLSLQADRPALAYIGALDKGLKPSDGPDRLIAVYGKPSRQGAGWLRFDSKQVCIHFSVNKKGIARITLMSPAVAP
jgi:cell wall assembly regulator SMI1